MGCGSSTNASTNSSNTAGQNEQRDGDQQQRGNHRRRPRGQKLKTIKEEAQNRNNAEATVEATQRSSEEGSVGLEFIDPFVSTEDRLTILHGRQIPGIRGGQYLKAPSLLTRLLLSPPLANFSLYHATPSRRLYITGLGGITLENLKLHQITTVVGVADELPELIPSKQNGLNCYKFSLQNSLSFPISEQLDSVADRIQTALQESSSNSSASVVVYCPAGMSRSATCLLAYSIKYQHMSLQEAFRKLHDCRDYARPNLAFWRALIAFEKRQKATTSVLMCPESLDQLDDPKLDLMAKMKRKIMWGSGVVQGTVWLPHLYRAEYPHLFRLELGLMRRCGYKCGFLRATSPHSLDEDEMPTPYCSSAHHINELAHLGLDLSRSDHTPYEECLGEILKARLKIQAARLKRQMESSSRSSSESGRSRTGGGGHTDRSKSDSEIELKLKSR